MTWGGPCTARPGSEGFSLRAFICHNDYVRPESVLVKCGLHLGAQAGFLRPECPGLAVTPSLLDN